MADTAASIVFSLISSIADSASRVRFNKRICARLSRKCQWIKTLLENIKLVSPSNPAWELLQEILIRCEKDLITFEGTGFLLRRIRNGGIPEICQMHIDELDDWVEKILDPRFNVTASQNNATASQDNALPDDEDEDEDEDEAEQEEAITFDITATQNQEYVKNALLSKPTPARLLQRAIVNPDNLSSERKQVGTFPFGIIYQGVYNKKDVYIRELYEDTPEEAAEKIRESVWLAQCLSDCCNVVPIYGVCGSRSIVTAMPSNGPLSEYTGEIKAIQKVAIARKIADALVFMNDIDAGKKKVVHRDIRAANILLSDGLEPMLTGFEMCKWDGDLTGYSHGAEESIKRWRPAETSIAGTSPQSDVYSFGVLMYEISTGKEPEDGADLVALENCRISVEYTKLMKRCLEPHYNARPKISTVMEELLSIETNLGLPAPVNNEE